MWPKTLVEKEETWKFRDLERRMTTSSPVVVKVEAEVSPQGWSCSKADRKTGRFADPYWRLSASLSQNFLVIQGPWQRQELSSR